MHFLVCIMNMTLKVAEQMDDDSILAAPAPSERPALFEQQPKRARRLISLHIIDFVASIDVTTRYCMSSNAAVFIDQSNFDFSSMTFIREDDAN